ncbi:MAG TPA: CGNR zinc finger domain-containing protein [Gemmatimonadales bacterium]|nr:CGNR zinc finger domain-containing protein [Gemmatimonadales bacterium]
MDPNDVKPAPGPLRVVQEFVNTRSNLRDSDLLEETDGTARWLAGHGLLPDGVVEVSEADRRRLISFREWLRRVLVVHNAGAEVREGEVAAIFEEPDDLAGAALLRVSFDPSGEPRLCPAEGKVNEVDKAMALMLVAVVRSAVDGTWERLKACRNEGCKWAFYDKAKNRSGTWCHMDACGARHKMRAYRERRSGRDGGLER